MTINKILCVDDELIWRGIFLRNFQERLTPNVELAESYTSALQKIRQTKYDLIVLDGLEGECFKIYRDIKNLPHGNVIIFSGNTQIKAETKEREIPFYNKPEATKELDKIIAQYKH